MAAAAPSDAASNLPRTASMASAYVCHRVHPLFSHVCGKLFTPITN